MPRSVPPVLSALQHRNPASISMLQPIFPLQLNVPHCIEEFGTANLQFLQSLHLKMFLAAWHDWLLEI
jgi:hypothetical protein